MPTRNSPTWRPDNSKAYYSEDRHRCWGKIGMIFEKTGIQYSHDEINYLCEAILQCSNQMDFLRMTSGFTKDDWEKYKQKSKEGVKQQTKEKIKKRTGKDLNDDELNHIYDELQKENTDPNGRWLGMYSDVEKMSDEELKERIKKAQEAVKEKMKRLRRSLGLPEQEVMREEAQRAYGQ